MEKTSIQWVKTPQSYVLRDLLEQVYDALSHNEAIFYGHGSDNPWDEAVYLVLAALELPLDSGEEVLDKVLTHAEVGKIEAFLEARMINKIPLPYLMKKAFFAGLEFFIDPRVIIPRSPIGELIETNFEICRPWSLDITQINSVLDLCAGSGCIGIAMGVYYDYLDIDLAELSQAAIEVAKINLDQYQVKYANRNFKNRVSLIQTDLFENLKNKTYDLILCNPPYVNAEDFETMPSEFSHEPVLALVSGQDGLDLTRRILQEAKQHLSPNGFLILEVGNSALALEQAYPALEIIWLELDRGGVGVGLIRQESL